jgi:hypothetical protein
LGQSSEYVDSPCGPLPDLVICPAGAGRNRDDTLLRWPVPTIARRPLAVPAKLDAARQACDQLQRDLAPWADLAGYLV